MRNLIFVAPALAFLIACSAPDRATPQPRALVALAGGGRAGAGVAYAAILGPARNDAPGFAAVRYALKHPPKHGRIAAYAGASSYVLWRSPRTAGGDRRLARALQPRRAARKLRHPARLAPEPHPRGRAPARGRCDRPPARRDPGPRGPRLQGRVRGGRTASTWCASRRASRRLARRADDSLVASTLLGRDPRYPMLRTPTRSLSTLQPSAQAGSRHRRRSRPRPQPAPPDPRTARLSRALTWLFEGEGFLYVTLTVDALLLLAALVLADALNPDPLLRRRAPRQPPGRGAARRMRLYDPHAQITRLDRLAQDRRGRPPQRRWPSPA